ncbi:MAG TPA: DUF4410 domain-containing protein [bacterium]
MRSGVNSASRLSGLVILGAVLVGCAGGQQSARQETSPQSTAASTVQKLSRKYSQVVFSGVEVPPQIAKDYPEAADHCRDGAIAELRKKGLFDKVEAASGEQTYGSDTLVVRTKIEDMRLVSRSARFWGGAFAGKSSMTLNVELVEAGTGNALGTQKLSSSNNAWGASWTFGSSDASLPSDMGAVVAEYVASVMPN